MQQQQLLLLLLLYLGALWELVSVAGILSIELNFQQKLRPRFDLP
jgi:hypothetical protein